MIPPTQAPVTPRPAGNRLVPASPDSPGASGVRRGMTRASSLLTSRTLTSLVHLYQGIEKENSKLICQHRSIRQALTGNQSNCILCNLDIIFDGTRWVWTFSVDAIKRRKLTTAYNVDRITGAHS